MPKEYQCTVREHIGYIGEPKSDHWWEVGKDISDQTISAEVSRQVEAKILPWLQSMSRLESVKNAVAAITPLLASAISLFLGNQAEAKTYLAEAIERKPLAGSKATAWGKKHGLL